MKNFRPFSMSTMKNLGNPVSRKRTDGALKAKIFIGSLIEIKSVIINNVEEHVSDFYEKMRRCWLSLNIAIEPLNMTPRASYSLFNQKTNIDNSTP